MYDHTISIPCLNNFPSLQMSLYSATTPVIPAYDPSLSGGGQDMSEYMVSFMFGSIVIIAMVICVILAVSSRGKKERFVEAARPKWLTDAVEKQKRDDEKRREHMRKLMGKKKEGYVYYY